MTIRLRNVSLGAGVQSTVLVLMAAAGEIGPMPDCATFSDTGWEPRKVYAHLDWLEKQLPFPVHRVSAGNLRNNIIDGSLGKRWASIPAFTTDGHIRRQCTAEFKVRPIRMKTRELAGIKGKRSPGFAIVEQWIGISTDEASRMKDSGESWWRNRYPLIEQRMSRGDCLEWMKRKNFAAPPKSACIGCPFHSDAYWRALRDGSPDEWQEAVSIDRLIRSGFRGQREPMFLHRQCVPLDEVDLSTAEDHGQLNMFNNECEGACGV